MTDIMEQLSRGDSEPLESLHPPEVRQVRNLQTQQHEVMPALKMASRPFVALVPIAPPLHKFITPQGKLPEERRALREVEEKGKAHLKQMVLQYKPGKFLDSAQALHIGVAGFTGGRSEPSAPVQIMVAAHPPVACSPWGVCCRPVDDDTVRTSSGLDDRVYFAAQGPMSIQFHPILNNLAAAKVLEQPRISEEDQKRKDGIAELRAIQKRTKWRSAPSPFAQA